MKFSQVPTNGAPALTDFLLGVSSGNVDQKTTLAILAAIFATNIPAGTIKNTMIDQTTAGKIWWEELGRVTLAAPATLVTTPTFAARKYLQVRYLLVPNAASINPTLRFNADSGANYASRLSQNGAADTTPVNQTANYIDVAGPQNLLMWGVMDIINIANQEKVLLGLSTTNGASGTGVAPTRREFVQKWTNIVNQITAITVDAGASMAAGTEIVVLGHN